MIVGMLDLLVLSYIAEEPICGKDLVEKIKKKTGGAWKVSFGSIYPLLFKMTKKGYIEVKKENRKKVYVPTHTGLEYLEGNKNRLFNEFISDFMTTLPLLSDLTVEPEFIDPVKKLRDSLDKIFTYVNAFPSGQRQQARMKVLKDFSHFLEYYTQGIK